MGTPWDGFGIVWGPLGDVLGSLGRSWGLLGPLGTVLGASWVSHWKLLGVSGRLLGPSSGCLGASWRVFFRLLAVLEAISHSLSVSEWFGIVLGTIVHGFLNWKWDQIERAFGCQHKLCDKLPHVKNTVKTLVFDDNYE